MNMLPALALLWLAGSTDAIAFVHGQELLAVYVTGNTTKLGGALLASNWARVLPLATLFATFAAATTLGAVLRRHLEPWGEAAVLALVAGLLGAAMAVAGEPFPLRKVLLIAGAMGALNQVLPSEPGATFITGTLVRFGRAMAAGKLGDAGGSLLRWVAFLAGAGVGALAETRYGSLGLAVPTVGAGVGMVVAMAAAWPRRGADRGVPVTGKR